MGLFERLRKSWVLSKYVRSIGPLLLKRYGPSEHYSPGRVRATLEHARSSLRYLPHACAMFCSREEFVSWMHDADEALARREAVRATNPYRALLKRLRPRERRSSTEYSVLYDLLRREAARENGESTRFLPVMDQDFAQWTPIPNEVATGTKAIF